METLFASLSVMAGSLLAVQAGANTQLSKAVGSPFAATLLQLTVAAVALTLVASLTGMLGVVADLWHVPWWHAIGGTASAFYVISTIVLFPRLGAVVSVGLFIAGQMLASLALDGFGLLGVPRQPIDAATVVGTLAVLAAAAAIVLGQKGAVSEFSVSRCGWIVLALLAGAVLPVQGAVNGLLRADIGAPFTVGAVSFFVATLSMAVALMSVIAFTDQPKPHLSQLAAVPWWGWLGGFAGAFYVTAVFTAIPVIGTAATVGLTVAGQQIASVFVDSYGWFRLPIRPVSALRLGGVSMLIFGVAVIKLL
jgi:bacterial/archaeal transporter family-2 protein